MPSSRFTALRAIAGAFAFMAVTAHAQDRSAAFAVPTIAAQRSADIRLSLADVGARAPQQIDVSGASFIKVHFDHFSLPAGLTLEVSNADGTEVYRYSKDKLDAHTSDARRGDDGQSRFSAMSISGSIAVLRLVGTAQERWTRDHGVTIGSYLEGFPEDLLPALQQEKLLSGPTPEAICGSNDKRAAACYQTSDTAAFDRTRPVARLVMGGGGLCTAWRVGADNRMFTNNHCFASTSEVAASEVWFNYQAASCTGTTSATTTKVPGDTLLKTDTTLDYSLFTVKNFATISSFGHMGLDVRVPTTGEEIFIPQHPGGRLKELATVSDQNGGGRCKVDAAITNGNGTNTDAGYKCDTEPGSSGSPVLARSSNKVIALHHLGGCNNTGAHIAKIWPQVATYFNNTIPAGDGGSGPGNQPPTANFSFTTNGLTAAFTDGSSDSDGSIASRSWNFGDSTTSTATSPSKTYSAAGTYTVTLSVTDNQGATNSTSRSVSVGSTALILQNGVPVSGLAAAANAEIQYTMTVPAGATNLVFQASGGTGDADLYVKYGAAPTTSSYDCRPYLGGNAETCTIAAPQAGTWYIKLRGYSAFSGVSLKGSYTTGSAGPRFDSTTDVAITDNATVESPITVSSVSGNAPAALKVDVTILHTYQGDLKVDLIAPNGTAFNLWNRTGAGTDNIVQTFTVNASAVAANGVWKLRVNDNGPGDTGKIDQWGLQF
ncbi:trypsin-like peptidase [Tahibacter aquaticus]|uniref:Trypsin-like peptidase n=1 Tax=Tahibacter aquaticus TaxID=520092 RepID=A0A4R6YHS5_9GAMM|nr:pre-peptidase C-terminal domain-containing protein [Tahibacter aquaticus]TDR36335.1 trypsin-like peptidase [Tahibacter aquaticus]